MPDLTSQKSARGRSAGRVRGFFSALRTLTMMQLKEKMDLSWTRSKRRSLFKIVWLLAEFVGVTVLCYLLIYAVKLLGVFSLVGDFPDTVMTVVFTFMTGLSLVFGTAGLVRSCFWRCRFPCALRRRSFFRGGLHGALRMRDALHGLLRGARHTRRCRSFLQDGLRQRNCGWWNNLLFLRGRCFRPFLRYVFSYLFCCLP